jgi:hypothetical protein
MELASKCLLATFVSIALLPMFVSMFVSMFVAFCRIYLLVKIGRYSGYQGVSTVKEAI